MNFRMILKISIKALNRSKVRSILTMLGIIIGVGALISMVSLGQGAQMQIQEAIAARGANLLYVRPGSRRTRGYHGGAGTINTLVLYTPKVISSSGSCLDVGGGWEPQIPPGPARHYQRQGNRSS